MAKQTSKITIYIHR